jgi:putative ABC transport system permease protein
MIRFLLRGLLRDRSRSLFPLLIVAVGVCVTVLFQSFMSGVMNSTLETNARFDAGHLKVTTRVYAERSSLKPNDLALTDVSKWLEVLKSGYPNIEWLPRIKFAALVDIPDAKGETKYQAPVMGLALNLLAAGSIENDNLGLSRSIVRGRLPQKSGEILVSEKLAQAFDLALGQKATLISSGMDNGMAVANFTIVGTLKFGVAAMDRGAVIADLKDVQQALHMDDSASEIIGLFSGTSFQDIKSRSIARKFNAAHARQSDKFSPLMVTLREQGDFGEYLDTVKSMIMILVSIFVFIVTLVFWSAGIRNGVRRYAEFGLRLAIGENKYHLYFSLIVESFFIGVAGSILGTAIGLVPAFYFMHYGLDLSGMLDNAAVSLMMPGVVRAQITPMTLWIGFVPGIVATELGTIIAGSAVFKRQTTQLFKELEI